MTRRRHSLAWLVALGALSVTATASAQEQPGYAVNHFNPSERGSQWFVLDSLDIRGNGRLALGVVNDYSLRSLVDYAPDGHAHASMVRHQYLAHLGASTVLADRVRIGVNVPLQLFVDGHSWVMNGVGHRAAEDVAVGDVRIAADVRLFGKPGAATLAFGAELYAPSGSKAAYTGDGEPRIHPRFLYSGQSGWVAYAARLGFMYRSRDEAFGDGYIGSAVTGALSAGALLADKKLLVGPEIFGSTVVADGQAFGSRTTPVEALLGAHYDVGANIRLGAGAGLGLTRSYGAPVTRGLLSIEWVPDDAKPESATAPPPPDRDKDGVPDCVDACGWVPGLKSDDPTLNGCPPPDADKDGVPDAADKCPLVPGPMQGCPADTDADGVLDTEDACPGQPGARSNDPRTNGCPDRDGDGVADPVDACPDQAGPASLDPKTNGCPDPDRDKDGVANDVDACPDQAGAADPDPKKNGCPKAFLDNGTIRILEQVKFKTASAEIVKGKESEDILGAVLEVMKAHPDIKKVRVEGHTDNKGNAAQNKALSQARAQSVVKWLTDHGVDKARLGAQGFGQEKPLDSNDTETGRTNNRRVEFHVEQGSAR